MSLSYGREEEFYEFCGQRGYEFFSFGGSETEKITRSNNPPIKVTLFWSRHDSKRVTGMEHYAWTGCRI